jgi:sugar lactone lactonase YvrE
MTPLNDLRCELGEGAFWHPLREEFYWFDITGRKLHAIAQSWDFDEMVSAMGWIDARRAVIASETRLILFDLVSGARETLCPLEAGSAITRSNDGRADRQGGFWIGTMGKSAQRGAGSIWRWHKGTLRRLFAGITIPNAISFAPDGRSACFTDTPTRKIMRVSLDAQGWPQGSPECWLDLNNAGLNPDGAVFDAGGLFWLAQWGASQVAAYGPDGQCLHKIAVPARHTSCPAFGGPDYRSLFCTTAREGLRQPTPLDGASFVTGAPTAGLAECAVGLADG